MQGSIITCCRGNLNGTPVLFLRSLRLARSRVIGWIPSSVVGPRPRSGEAVTPPRPRLRSGEAETSSRGQGVDRDLGSGEAETFS
jgi:hypothetical protein